MDSTSIGIILGSSVVSVIITSFFSHMKDKKDAEMQYITAERQAWREKIRKISEAIEKAEYNGQEDKNIELYLVQLEVNINPYGKDVENNFEKDSHIWSEIDSIKNVKNEEEFDKHKELLIYYLSLMLKEDWERSKQEVKGYSRTFKELVLILFINIIVGGYYAYKLEDKGVDWIDVLSVDIILTTMFYIFIRYFQDIYISNTVKNNRFRKSYYGEGLIINMILVIFVFMIYAGLFIILNICFKELVWLNLYSFFVCYIESLFVLYKGMEFNFKKAGLTQKVIGVREKLLNENKKKIDRYKRDIDHVYDYLKDNQHNVDKIKPSIVSLKKLIKEYKIELRIRRRELRREFVNRTLGKEYNKIQVELKEMDALLDKIERFSREGIINRVYRLISELHIYKKLKKVFLKIFLYVWNRPGNFPL